MADVTAKLKYHHLAPRKVRLVADLVRGKKVGVAMSQLAFSTKKSAQAIAKLLKSAVSNAKHNFKIDADKKDLYIKEIRVDEGPPMKRYRTAWRGTTKPFKRRTSHVVIVLGEKTETKTKKIKKIKKHE
ncbi:MAG: 50S ribosomal protein L22 [Candidatus Paceibacterota bacterium]